MTTVNLGRIKPIYKGVYSAVTAYQPLDFVSYSGAAYFCTAASTGNLPTNTAYFAPVVDINALVSVISGSSKVPVTAADGTFNPTWLAAFTTHIVVPQNTTPANAALYVAETPTLVGSGFTPTAGATLTGAQIQISLTDWGATVYDSGLSAQTTTSMLVSAGKLVAGTVYYWRIRYQNSLGGLTAWSVPTSFTTRPSFTADVIYTPTTTPANFGDALEGGYYTGMIWNELVHSDDSKLIATGALVLTVSSMTANPLVYVGQTLEVRSRANPANKMIGTVTAAAGTSLTLSISSVGGAGTFTDWSVMARYRVIVSPKSSGESNSRMYKNANTSAPTACQTVAEGYKATQAMVSAADATIYPAAHFCATLNIGGKRDWYLPARDELELCWRNLKPTTVNNYVTADRYNSGINYTNFGSLDDPDIAHGHNMNSSPEGDAYTMTVPAQTAVADFQAGGAQAFAYGSFYYWSSSEISAASAWYQYWFSSVPGNQSGNGGKTNGCYVRAVRRSVI